MLDRVKLFAVAVTLLGIAASPGGTDYWSINETDYWSINGGPVVRSA